MKARWFSVKLNRTTAPYLYVKGEPFKTIASAELLAVTLAVMVFGPAGKWRRGAGRVAVTRFTDNISNAYLLDKYLTTKVLPKMLEAAMSLDEEIQLKKTSKQKPSFADKAPADQKLRLTQPW